jgi:cysteine sulfinate desulfinase/cysteine desulfurase-like protein
MGYTNSPYYTYTVGPNAATEIAARGISSKPSVTEESLQQKVDAKIDSIMSAHKADMLSQQISRLTDKVQKLSNNIEYKQSGVSSSSISASESGETEMSRRLRKLAAESSRRAVSDGPNF